MSVALVNVLVFDEHLDEQVVEFVGDLEEGEIVDTLETPAAKRRQAHDELGKTGHVVAVRKLALAAVLGQYDAECVAHVRHLIGTLQLLCLCNNNNNNNNNNNTN